jgi:hypothetical protein
MYSAGDNFMFESVPSEGYRSNLFHCFIGKRKHQDKGTQVTKETKKWHEAIR